MALEIIREHNELSLSFENVVSLWAILKEVLDTPYLSSFVVENYDGGNTLVPLETWDDEGILYRKLKGEVFLFPYESAGFVFDDSIHNIDIFIVDSYTENTNYKTDYKIYIGIRNTDRFTLKVKNDRSISRIIALYILHKLKIGYSNDIIIALDNMVRSIMNPKLKSINPELGTLTYGIKGMHFVIKTENEDHKSQFYLLSFRKKFKKKTINEKDIRNLAYLKKKVTDKGPLFKIIYVSILLFIPFFLVFIIPKIFDVSKMKMVKWTFIGVMIMIFLNVIYWLLRKFYLKIPRNIEE